MIGNWDVVEIHKPAVWTPKGGRVTAKKTRKWILDGRVVMDTSILSNGTESINLRDFDPQSKAYRSWWFNFEANAIQQREVGTKSRRRFRGYLSWMTARQ
jgi:hypothetical protein